MSYSEESRSVVWTVRCLCVLEPQALRTRTKVVVVVQTRRWKEVSRGSNGPDKESGEPSS